ncbi:hypothetical protein EYF80_057159 [Liparis tanakae]|uniref:Uncharacterized protein n=1 Tax=Liparis tanakae TaxID=230148 RepID=A0A4Z2EV44_9TELE|nr:hypothetical protein EYF80_057159 [Liparis tanakae]
MKDWRSAGERSSLAGGMPPSHDGSGLLSPVLQASRGALQSPSRAPLLGSAPLAAAPSQSPAQPARAAREGIIIIILM